MIRRLLDVFGALAVLAVTWPVFLVVAVAIKRDSPGPVFYTQLRAGRRGQRFRLYKFRSMVTGADTGSVITGPSDPRITRLGQWIRLARIDELPQLLNVLKGDMSLVGPRPETPSIVERYTGEQREILDVRPGITGPTQLAWIEEAEGFPTGVDPAQYYVTYVLPQKLESDLRYVRSQSLAGDLQYLIETPVRIGQLVLARPGLGRLLKHRASRSGGEGPG